MNGDQMMAVVLERLDQIEAHIKRIDEVLTGNGTPQAGLQTRLTRLEDSVENCQARYDNQRTKRSSYVRIIVTAWLTALAAGILGAIGYFLRGKT